jgi:hypothetical protein
MKRLFALLVLINIGLFAWGFYQSQREPPGQLRLAGGNLQLLAEREAAEARPAPEEYALQRAPAPERFPGAAEPEPVAAAPAEPQEPTAADTPRPEPEPEPEPEPIETAPTDDSAEAGTEPSLRRCHALGAFASRDGAQSVAARLASIGLAATLRREIVQRQGSFWVMVPPMGSREAARDMEQRLRNAGFEDIWRVVDGDMQNAISLGLYSREAGAKRRLAQARGQDIPAEIRSRQSEAEEFWLDFPADREVDTDALERRLARDYPEIRIVERDCVRLDTP